MNLLAACALADVVTMGGSFNEIGGHNPLEPALFHKPVIVGPNMSNFKEILAQLISAQAIVQIAENDAMPPTLAAEVLRLLSDSAAAQSAREKCLSSGAGKSRSDSTLIDCFAKPT